MTTPPFLFHLRMVRGSDQMTINFRLKFQLELAAMKFLVFLIRHCPSNFSKNQETAEKI